MNLLFLQNGIYYDVKNDKIMVNINIRTLFYPEAQIGGGFVI
jgi:hypothetical protein